MQQTVSRNVLLSFSLPLLDGRCKIDGGVLLQSAYLDNIELLPGIRVSKISSRSDIIDQSRGVKGKGLGFRDVKEQGVL